MESFDMKIIFLGTGSAFTLDENYQSNMLIEVPSTNRKLLIDCGSDIRWSLKEAQIDSRNLDVYISHLHADHIGGLEWLAFTSKFDPHSSKPHLYISMDLLDDLWRSLKSGLISLPEKEINLSTYFEIHPIEDKDFQWQGHLFEIFPTIHVQLATSQMPSYGLFFQVNEKNILLTTDTQFVPDYMRNFYEKADLIFHDCETSPTKSGVHAHYTQLVSLDPAIKAKMWLYHYQSKALPNAQKDGFKGFIKKGQVFNL